MSNLDLFQHFAPKASKSIKTGNQAVIYTRVSHHSQEDNTSLESQKRYCEEFAVRRQLNVVSYFGGTYESAKTDDRKEFNKMLAYVKRSKDVAYVIVYSYERFSRSGINGASIADDLLKKYGVVTLAVTQELDPRTPAGAFQQNILFLFGQMDNELRRDKTITGMRELLRKGYYLHSLPKGYTNLNKGSKAVDQKIVVNDEGALIRKAFHWKADKKYSNAEICRQLDRRGFKLDERRLAEIFANPFYCGIIVSKMLPNQVIEGQHEAMVSRKLFLSVNNIIAETRNHPLVHQNNDNHLPLKRFMRCGECDTPMTGFLVKKKGLYYYKCRTKGCKTTKSARDLHSVFKNVLSTLLISEEDIEVIKKGTIEVCETVFQEKRESEKLLKRKLKEVEGYIESIDERHAIGKVSFESFEKNTKKYETKRADILEDLAKCTVDSSNLEKMVDYCIKISLKPLLLWENGKVEDRLGLQNFIFPKGIIYNKQKRGVQTFRINSFFTIIPMISRFIKGIKKGDPINFDRISALVTSPGFKPGTS
ncbi:MAG: resolvase [Crocinitomix sp.]|nr:resolvase [Crocinitomix sp.]